MYGENYHNTPDYGCQRSPFFETVVITWGIFFVV